MSQPDLFRLPRKPWNVGRMIGAKAPFKPKHIWAIRQHLKSIGSVRDLAMFNIALDAKLRGCDLVKLRLRDIAQGGIVRQRSTTVQQKTGGPVPFEITEAAKDALVHWLERRGDAVTTGCFRAAAEKEHTSVLGTMLAWSMPGYE